MDGLYVCVSVLAYLVISIHPSYQKFTICYLLRDVVVINSCNILQSTQLGSTHTKIMLHMKFYKPCKKKKKLLLLFFIFQMSLCAIVAVHEFRFPHFIRL